MGRKLKSDEIIRILEVLIGGTEPVGDEAVDEQHEENLKALIDTRYRQKKPLIVTTNLSGDQLKDTRDISYRRVLSRLYEMCTFLEVQGRDRRKAKNRENHAETERLIEEERNAEAQD